VLRRATKYRNTGNINKPPGLVGTQLRKTKKPAVIPSGTARSTSRYFIDGLMRASVTSEVERPATARIPASPRNTRMCRHSTSFIDGGLFEVSGATTPYWQNGYCESFNAKLRDELLNGEILYSFWETYVIIENCRVHNNTRRPHSAMGCRPPEPLTLVPYSAPFDQAPRMQ